MPSFPLGLRGSAIRFSRLDSDFPYLLDIPQSRIEWLLARRAADLGADIRWSSRVTGLAQDAGGVTVTLDDGRTESADYVVGCDGVRSFAREAAGLPFPGAPNPGSVILADLYLDGLPMTDAYGDLSEQGMLLVFPFRDGSCRLVLYDFARAGVPVTEPVTMAEIADGLARVAGRDFGPRDVYWSGRYRSESRQAVSYRNGRVFLAGDAAHTHSPAGAQGMNTGLQDAVNLGWKLGAALAGWAPAGLLDTYHSERHPVGTAVLTLTGRQFRLNTARTRPRRALRWTAERVIVPLPFVQNRLARSYTGLAVRYPPGGTDRHPLTGTRLPPGRLLLPGGASTRLPEFFHDGRFVLLDRDAGAGPAGASRAGGPPAVAGARGERGPEAGPGGGGLPGHVRAVRYARSDGGRLPAAALVRPDGYLAWASDEPDARAREQAAMAAVARCCAPAPAE